MISKTNTTQQERLDLLYDLLEDMHEVPKYEYGDFSNGFHPFLTQRDRQLILDDFQLIKRMSSKYYYRLLGRYPEL